MDLSRFPLESPGNGLNLPAEHDEGDGRADEDHAADEGGCKGFIEYEDTYKDGGERFHDAENGRQGRADALDGEHEGEVGKHRRDHREQGGHHEFPP